MMVVCPACNRMVDDSLGFCPACGTTFTGKNIPRPSDRAPGQAYPYMPGAHRNPFVAVILSFLFSGMGQIYVGKMIRGITYIIIETAFTLVMMSFLPDTYTMQDVLDLFNDPYFLAVCAAHFVFWTYNMFDAYRLARKFNAASVRNDLPRFFKGF